MKKIITFILILAAIVLILWHRTARANVNAAPTNPILFCPHASQLQKNPKKGNWRAETAQGLWKSYGLSFATSITKFVGAQWVGENVGQVTCIYNSEQSFTNPGNNQTEIQPTLPVLLVFHTLTFQPTAGKWKHVKRGVYNCYSLQQTDCPFKMNVKTSVGNLFQEAEEFKSENTNSTPQPIH